MDRQRVLEVATRVRAAAELLAERKKRPADLGGMCAIVSAALVRAQNDPDFGYHMAGTETWRRLCEAEAAILAEDAQAVRARRLDTFYDGRRARVLELREQIERLSEHPID